MIQYKWHIYNLSFLITHLVHLVNCIRLNQYSNILIVLANLGHKHKLKANIK